MQAWKSWNERTTIYIVDPSLNKNSRNEMMRCIHIGLLCVQENLADRPTMATIMLMNANNVTPTKDNTQLLRIKIQKTKKIVETHDQKNCEISHTLTKALGTMLSEGSSRCHPSAITALD